METNQNPNPMNESQKSIGPAIGIIIIVAVIVLGGLYFWEQRQKQNQTATSTDSYVNELNSQESSDDLNSIDADLKATDLEALGGEVNSAEAAAAVMSQ